MNGFDAARAVEFLAWQRLKPFINEISDGRFVLVNKGRHARRLQEELGDILANLPALAGADPFNAEGRLFSIEIKAEKEDKHGNLFLESWSNRNLHDALSHAERGSNPGWLYKTRADLLFYYFIDSDKLCVATMFALQRWAFGAANHAQSAPWGLFNFPEKRQSKYQQANDTWGFCVPITDLQKALGPKQFKVTTARQLGFFDTWEAAQ